MDRASQAVQSAIRGNVDIRRADGSGGMDRASQALQSAICGNVDIRRADGSGGYIRPLNQYDKKGEQSKERVDLKIMKVSHYTFYRRH
jgi:hypothetical protein